jgi:hypothetical protein
VLGLLLYLSQQVPTRIKDLSRYIETHQLRNKAEKRKATKLITHLEELQSEVELLIR